MQRESLFYQEVDPLLAQTRQGRSPLHWPQVLSRQATLRGPAHVQQFIFLFLVILQAGDRSLIF